MKLISFGKKNSKLFHCSEWSKNSVLKSFGKKRTAGFEILKSEKFLLKRKCIVKRVLKKSLWTRGQSGYPQVTCRGRVEALGIRIESGRQKVLPVRRLPKLNSSQVHFKTHIFCIFAVKEPKLGKFAQSIPKKAILFGTFWTNFLHNTAIFLNI